MSDPSGTVTVYTFGVDAELVKASTGVFYVDWTFLLAGDHYWRMEGTGAVTAAAEDFERVRTSQIV